MSELSIIVNKMRVNALKSIYHAGSGHPGGVLSSIDLIAYLFLKEMSYDIKNMNNPARDRFILSKGHSVPALYAVAVEVGLLEESQLKGLRKINHDLQGHPHRGSLSWIDASTGSLGQGFSFAIGEALGYRHQNINNRTYVMLGDGEQQEGEVWEGAMFAAHHQLDNLCAIIDYNKMQSDALNKDIINLESLADKWRAFNWDVQEIDGHDFGQMQTAFNNAKETKNKPAMIIAHTIKGKGVSFMEGIPAWHGSVKLTDEELATAISELQASCTEEKEDLTL